MRDPRSPWSSNQHHSVAIVEPFRGPINGTVTPPGSKSATNRALIIAAAARGTSKVRNILKSDDSYWCVEALRQVGVDVAPDGDDVSITSEVAWKTPTQPIYIGSAGTTARFLTSVLGLTTNVPLRIRASAQMSQRPMRPLFEALSTLGCGFHFEDEAFRFPVALRPERKPAPASVRIAGGQSSQYLSGLLIATPLLPTPVTIQVDGSIVQRDYVRITLDVMRHFGVAIEPDDAFKRFEIAPSAYAATDYQVEPDASTASYFFALAALTGGNVVVSGLSTATLQPDIQFLSILRQMGCVVDATGKQISVTGPPKLRGGFTANMREFSDTALTLAALAPFADGPIEITGVAHIRMHESDRIHAMATELTRVGVPVQENDDGLRIQPAQPTRARVQTYDDHRMAMSLALVALGGAGLEIEDPGCVSKTCPMFFEELRRFGANVEFA